MSLQGLLSEKSRPAALAVPGRLFQCLYDLLWRPGSRFLFVRVEDDFDVAKSAMEFTEHRLQTPCIVCPEQSLSLAEEKRIADGMRENVRVGMPEQPFNEGYFNTTEDQFAIDDEAMNIIPDSEAYFRMNYRQSLISEFRNRRTAAAALSIPP